MYLVLPSYDVGVDQTAGWEGTVHFAAWQGDGAAVARLISEGTDVNAQGAGGRTPLMEAVDEPEQSFDRERAEVVQLLLAAGASLSASDNDGWTALHHGTRAGRRAVVVLLEAGADPNAKAADGSTPLHCAVEYGDSDAVSVLLDHGASALCQNRWGVTPLQVAELEVSKFPEDDDAAAVLRLLGRAANRERWGQRGRRSP
jgi:ankyrin repeat protein